MAINIAINTKIYRIQKVYEVHNPVQSSRLHSITLCIMHDGNRALCKAPGIFLFLLFYKTASFLDKENEKLWN